MVYQTNKSRPTGALKAELVRRALASYGLADMEWEQLRQFMPPKTGKRETDWRAACDAWIVRFAVGQHGIAWAHIPNSSTYRMAMVRALKYGIFGKIAAALPQLQVRHEIWRRVIAGARTAAVGRRQR